MKILKVLEGFIKKSKRYKVPNDLIEFVNSLKLEKPVIYKKILLDFSNHNIKKL